MSRNDIMLPPMNLGRAARLVAPVLLAAVLLAPSAVLAQEDLDERSVYEAFADYKAAIREADAETAFQRVDSTTLGYYADMLHHARSTKKKQLHELRLIDLMMVLSIRHRLPAKQVRKMDAEALFKRGVESGWIGDVKTVELAEVEIDGDTAWGTFEANGAASPTPFRFVREGGRWRIDLTSIMEDASAALLQIAEQQNRSGAAFVMLILESVTGEPVDESTLWKPLDRR